MTDDAPRRRMVDKDRRRWNDRALDLLGTRVEDVREGLEELRMELRTLIRLPGEFAAFRREFDEWKRERRDDIVEFRTDIAELQRENKQAHHNIAYGKDPVDGNKQLPPQPAKLSWGDVVKVATAVSLVLGPIAVIVAALLGGSS